MTEHKHEWTLKYKENLEDVGGYGLPAYCVACNATMRSAEIEHRLNEYERLKRATDVLSAEDAKEIYLHCEMAGIDWPDNLLAYARILSEDV